MAQGEIPHGTHGQIGSGKHSIPICFKVFTYILTYDLDTYPKSATITMTGFGEPLKLYVVLLQNGRYSLSIGL